MTDDYKKPNGNLTFFRVNKNKENPFVMIDKRIVENPGLSWDAKGMLAYLLSRPNNWIVNVTDLVNRGPQGVTAVRSIVKELVDAGYMVKRIERGEHGIFKRFIFEVYEDPTKDKNDPVYHEDQPLSGITKMVNNHNGESPFVGDPTLINTDLNNNIDLPDKVGKGDNPEPGPAISDLKPSSPGGVRLLAVLKAEATARAGRPVRGYTKFPTLAIRDKFLKAEEKLGLGLDDIIRRALEAGCTSVPRAVNYIARVAENGNGRKPVGPGGNGKGPGRSYPKSADEALEEFRRKNPNYNGVPA